MSAHAYTKDQLVEQPARAEGPPSPRSSPSGRGDDGLFAGLGWQVAQPHPHTSSLPAGEKITVDELSLLSHETTSEVALGPRLNAALERLNPTLPCLRSGQVKLASAEQTGHDSTQL
jgi:hypothetical protein